MNKRTLSTRVDFNCAPNDYIVEPFSTAHVVFGGYRGKFVRQYNLAYLHQMKAATVVASHFAPSQLNKKATAMTYDVVIVIGSQSDLDKVQRSKMLIVLNEVGVSWELSVISAHRNPTALANFVNERNREGTMVFIGIAGMSAALPGVLASLVDGLKPVLGVALSASILDGLDALLSQARMPPSSPVMVCGIDEAGLYNAALAACSIIALTKQPVREKLAAFLENNNKQPVIGLLASDKTEGG